VYDNADAPLRRRVRSLHRCRDADREVRPSDRSHHTRHPHECAALGATGRQGNPAMPISPSFASFASSTQVTWIVCDVFPFMTLEWSSGESGESNTASRCADSFRLDGYFSIDPRGARSYNGWWRRGYTKTPCQTGAASSHLPRSRCWPALLYCAAFESHLYAHRVSPVNPISEGVPPLSLYHSPFSHKLFTIPAFVGGTRDSSAGGMCRHSHSPANSASDSASQPYPCYSLRRRVGADRAR
jgi:hypothetical protein